MKSSTVRGTPINSISNPGYNQTGLKNFDGVVNKQFEGDQSQQPQSGSGTPYNSKNGNPADAKSAGVGSGAKGGIVLSENGINMNAPESNGTGVVFDGVTEARDYVPPAAATMDSPVPSGAQKPIIGSGNEINQLKSGEGSAIGRGGQIKDQMLEMGGVMSRGMVGTSTPGGGATELVTDDIL